jgi:two-component system response regulator PilR (NtrC family)
MTRQRVLIVDDEPDIRELLEITLLRMGLETRSAEDYSNATRLLHDESFDLCLTDMKLPDGDGIALVEYIQQHCPNTPTAVITAHGSIDLAIKAMKCGAFDFVSKPVSLETLRNLVDKALTLPSSPQLAGDPADTRYQIIGDSAVMGELKRSIAKFARSQAPVFISGASGTGKELVARQIHLQGSRAGAAFIAVNCGAIPSELMESEFFGHLKGSFTGATSDNEGLFKAANGGTLFLDEMCGRRPAGRTNRRPHYQRLAQGYRRDGSRRQFPPGSLLPDKRHRYQRTHVVGADRGYCPTRRLPDSEA